MFRQSSPQAGLKGEGVPMMTIHNFARGGRGQRVMWLCEEMGLPYRVKIHAFPLGAGYRAFNPLGTV
jgi:glutathione S-transferase